MEHEFEQREDGDGYLKFAITFIIGLLASLVAAGCISSPHISDSVHAGGVGEWYKALRPGITRSDIVELAGNPSSSGNIDRYDLKRGHLELKYKDNVLIDCTHCDPGDGALSQSLYHAWGGELSAAHIMERRDYLNRAEYASLPKFEGQRLRTAFHDGICYKVDTSYLVIEPMLSWWGAHGYYLDKAARVSLIDSEGKVEVLYKAIDNWRNLKPPSLSVSQINSRMKNLRSLGNEVVGKPFYEILGAADAGMGSGRDLRLFYLKDGLAVALITGATGILNSGVISSIGIMRPGEATLSLDEWMKKAQQSH